MRRPLRLQLVWLPPRAQTLMRIETILLPAAGINRVTDLKKKKKGDSYNNRMGKDFLSPLFSDQSGVPPPHFKSLSNDSQG